jgi:hypothetical protein
MVKAEQHFTALHYSSPPHYSITPTLHYSTAPLGRQNLIASFICPHWEQRERSTSGSSV